MSSTKTILLGVVIFLLVAGCSVPDDPTLPHTLAELNQWYVEPPTDENAATFYLQGFAALNIAPEDRNSRNLPIIGPAQIPSPGDPIKPAMISAINELVQRNQTALDLFEKGAALDQSRYPIDLTQGDKVSLKHLNKIRQASRVIQLSALSHALAGDGADAGQDILTSFALAKSLEQEPLLFSQLIRGACDFGAVNALEETLKRTAIPADTLSELARTLKQAEERETAGVGVKRGVVGERAKALAFFDLPPDQQQEQIKIAQTMGNNPGITFSLDPNLLPADRQLLAQTYNQLLYTFTKDFPERRDAQDKILKKRTAEAMNRKLAVSATRLASLERLPAGAAWLLAYLRLAQTTVALEQFRAAHNGSYPDSLKQLVPTQLADIPRDPFDGKNLRYTSASGGYFIYSVGPDRKDNGGMSGGNGRGNIVFNMINPPKVD